MHIPYLYVKSQIIAVQISVCESEFAGSKTVLFIIPIKKRLHTNHLVRQPLNQKLWAFYLLLPTQASILAKIAML